MYLNIPVVVTHHAAMRYAQRVDYLLPTELIKEKIKQIINPETCQKLGKHQQIINGMRYVISATNEVITITHIPKNQKDRQDGNRNGNNNKQGDSRKRERALQSREKRYTANDKRATLDDKFYQRDN